MSASASRTSLYDEIAASIIAEFEADRVPGYRAGRSGSEALRKMTVTHAVFI
jgi:antirestriction protein ArdC